MSLQTIYVVRHGFRTTWSTDPTTGRIKSTICSPTNIPGDVPLTAYGVRQAAQLAARVVKLEPTVKRVYSSLFWRCLQTVQPAAEQLGVEVVGNKGLGEWFGTASFTHPSPAPLPVLQNLLPTLTLSDRSSIIPSPYGESIATLHDRCAYALASIIADCDSTSPLTHSSTPGSTIREGEPYSILLCTHAAAMIAIGRALTGKMPGDVSERDFHVYTASISRFDRITRLEGADVRAKPEIPLWAEEGEVPDLGWRGSGVGGGWRCVWDAETGHLDGADRDWHFSGDESFIDDMIKGEGDKAISRVDSDIEVVGAVVNRSEKSSKL